MKLLFPNGEHAPVVLSGKTLIGSGNDAQVVLLSPGVAPHHASMEFDGAQTKVVSLHPANEITVNGKPIVGHAVVSPGDLLTFSGVRVRAVAIERAPAPAVKSMPPAPLDSADDGRTKVRVALPKFVLRGVSGVTFGKVFPVHGTMVIGRQAECEISIQSDEISRRHAELKATPDGVMVEDLGSSNGTYVNDRRITRHTMKSGDELRLDTIRFLLLAPGQDIQQAQTKTAETKKTVEVSQPSNAKNVLMWSIVIVAVLTLSAVAAKVMGMF